MTGQLGCGYVIGYPTIEGISRPSLRKSRFHITLYGYETNTERSPWICGGIEAAGGDWHRSGLRPSAMKLEFGEALSKFGLV